MLKLLPNSCVPSAIRRRLLHSSLQLSRDTGSHMHADTPEVVEDAKKRVLQGKGDPQAIPGAEGWEQSLASVSEAIVKAEKMAQDLSPKELQELSIKTLSKGQDTSQAGKNTKM